MFHRLLEWWAHNPGPLAGSTSVVEPVFSVLLHAARVRVGAQLSRLAEEKGALLLESLVAVGLLVTVLSATVAGLSTASISVRVNEERTTAQNIARSQLEHTMNEPFCAAPCSYPTIATPTGFTVTSDAVAYNPPDPNLETIFVTVYRDGQAVVSIEGLKANR